MGSSLVVTVAGGLLLAQTPAMEVVYLFVFWKTCDCLEHTEHTDQWCTGFTFESYRWKNEMKKLNKCEEKQQMQRLTFMVG